MIGRVWHGRTRSEKAEEYLEYLRKTGVKDQTSLQGNRGDYVFRRFDGEVAHFLVISLWDSMDAVRQFAGTDAEKPVYYPEDERYLLELEPDITHYEIVVAPA